uniref:Transposase Tc1-like domain-containing protein n=1 Tax=Clytia hemisphaerica TaxID=252671 RepID=A0A7M5WW91_9CNID|eukprot:TCONS_00051771-protein
MVKPKLKKTSAKKPKDNKLSVRDSIKLAVLHQEQGVSCYELTKRFGKKILERTIYRHAKKPLDQLSNNVDRRTKNPGRPKKVDARRERIILRSLKKLCTESVAFTAGKVLEESNLAEEGINKRDVQRCLRKNNYRYLQSRKKGLLIGNDKTVRVAWARKHVKNP